MSAWATAGVWNDGDRLWLTTIGATNAPLPVDRLPIDRPGPS